MTLTLIPDCKKITLDYLRTHADIVALGARALGETPSDTSTPWVRVTQLDAAKAGDVPTDYLTNFLLQLDCYVGRGDPMPGQPQARELARTVRAVLNQMRGVRGGAMVTATFFVGMAELFDTNLEPARDYVQLSAEVYVHA